MVELCLLNSDFLSNCCFSNLIIFNLYLNFSFFKSNIFINFFYFSLFIYESLFN